MPDSPSVLSAMPAQSGLPTAGPPGRIRRPGRRAISSALLALLIAALGAPRLSLVHETGVPRDGIVRQARRHHRPLRPPAA